jgi:hypothetical protein
VGTVAISSGLTQSALSFVTLSLHWIKGLQGIPFVKPYYCEVSRH